MCANSMNNSLFDPGEAEASQELFLERMNASISGRQTISVPAPMVPHWPPDSAPMAKRDQPDRQHLLIGIVEHHQLPQVLVPVVGNADGGEGQHR